MMRCCIKKNVTLFGMTAVALGSFGIFLFPHPARAAWLDEIVCTGGGVPSLSGFLYLFIQIAQWILGITGSLALLMFVIGGFMWLISGGRQQWIEMGQKTLVNALIGLLIVFGSWFLIDIVIGTIAPNIRASGGWYTFDATLCTPDRTASFGGIVDAPVAEKPKEINSLEDKHSEDKPLHCMPAQKAEDACLAAQKKGDKGTLTTEGCKAGEKKCDITSKNGIECDARYNNAKGYINDIIREGGGCTILCGKKLPGGERLSEKTPGALCCQCIDANSVELEDQDCGNLLDDPRNIEKKSYKCCKNKNPAAKIKVKPCKKGEAFSPPGYDCYCTLGLVGSICAVDEPHSGCKMTNLSCMKVSELERYFDCEGTSGGEWWKCKASNISRGLVQIPIGWSEDMWTAIAGKSALGICQEK